MNSLGTNKTPLVYISKIDKVWRKDKKKLFHFLLIYWRGASDMYHISIGILLFFIGTIFIGSLLFFIGKIEFFYRSNIISRLKSVFSVHFSFVWTTNQPPKKVFFVRELPKYTWERKREKIDCIVFFVFDIILKTIKQLIKNMNLHNFAIV